MKKVVFASPKYNYVTIDANAQIEFALNDKYEVTKVISLNEEADIVIEGLKLAGLSLEEATGLVVDDAIKLGYIDEFNVKNRVYITAYADEEGIRERIEEKVSLEAIKFLKEKNILHSVIKAKVSDELKKTAEQNKISYGKLLLVEKAYSLNNSLDKGKLMKLSIKEIQKKINLSVNERIKEKGGDSEQYHQELKNRKEGKMKQNRNRINNIINDILENNKELLDSLSGVEREEMIKKLINDEKNIMGNRQK